MALTLDTLKSATRSRWLLPVLLVVVALVVAWRLDSGRRAEGAVARLAEAEVLRLKKVEVAAQEREAQLKARLGEAVAFAEGLGAELARVRAAAPGARTVLVARGSTGPVKAGGLPRAPEERGPAAGEGEEQAEAAGPQSHDPQAAERPAAPACLLAEGDLGEVRAAVAGLETRAGNLVVVGAAEAWRVSPPPAARLFGGPLRLEAAVEERGGGPGGWGGGARVQAGRRGVLAGPALALPPWHLWRYQLEATADGVIEVDRPAPGQGREWYVGGTLLLRRWR